MDAKQASEQGPSEEIVSTREETMLRNAHRLLRRRLEYRTGFTPLWSMVSEITSHGSTVSKQICRALGWTPEANARGDLPPRLPRAAVDMNAVPIPNGPDRLIYRGVEYIKWTTAVDQVIRLQRQLYATDEALTKVRATQEAAAPQENLPGPGQ